MRTIKYELTLPGKHAHKPIIHLSTEVILNDEDSIENAGIEAGMVMMEFFKGVHLAMGLGGNSGDGNT